MEKNAKILLDKYLSGNCTPNEKAIVEQWYLQLPFEGDTPQQHRITATQTEVWEKLQHGRQKAKQVLLFKRIAVAASILLCLSVGLYLAMRNNEPQQFTVSAKNDVKPGRNKALLTLADGSVIDLDNAKTGQLATQSGIVVRKTANGKLEYIIKDNPGNATQAISTNVITTPRGGQYEVTLPDGTKVWLNAASSLKYPSSFAKNERKVELQGEAYFEVAKDKNRPFRVATNQQTVEVLGTHFNINAYSDEAQVKTTLLEGAVNVSSGTNSLKLKPGQQALLNLADAKLHMNPDVDVDKEMAWKNDLFAFDNDDLKTIMRQISRWYDLDVVYQGKITNEKYVGEIPRNSNLSEVFKILELNHVHIDAKGKVLTVSGSKTR
ncbi:FecR family protein [Pedobacter soli]|uniref:FecR family protein n=1 Tax=Pedobacter soli TaxID=390242 RepID=A0A1G6XV02_9SPHI|nr:FecR family protein [Pedobacter soli]SDD81257.1 FecR family protein [Pedobacter soli]